MLQFYVRSYIHTYYVFHIHIHMNSQVVVVVVVVAAAVASVAVERGRKREGERVETVHSVDKVKSLKRFYIEYFVHSSTFVKWHKKRFDFSHFI